MGVLNLGIGIVGLIILFGILSAGSTSEITEKYSDMNIINTLDFDTFLDELDYNIINKLDVSFEDKNIPGSFKKAIHYITRGAIDGVYSSIYLGKLVNDIEPGIYVWLKENIWTAIIIILLLMRPQVLGIVTICILGLIFNI